MDKSKFYGKEDTKALERVQKKEQRLREEMDYKVR